MSIVAELQREALDDKASVTSLLRKALVVADKLDHVDMAKWIEHELNGYKPGADDIPEYRQIGGIPQAYNEYRGWEPIQWQNPKHAERFGSMNFHFALSEIESMLNEKGRGSTVIFTYTPEVDAMLRQALQPRGIRPALHVDASQLRGIVHAVRNVILKWSLELEKKGVQGEGFTFSPQEKAKAAPTSMTFNIGTMYQPQIQSDVQGSAVQTLAPNTLDLDSVAKLIGQIEKQVTREAPSALCTELQADIASIKAQLGSPKPKHPVPAR